jgi:putative two-component system response regulator
MSEKATVLIVDDIEANREVLEDQVILMGHTPITANNGLSALAQMEKRTPDLVLLDIMMPEMTGDEVLRRMKTDSALQYIPVIVISAIDDMDSIAECISAGAEDYLIKPYNKELLAARIGNAFEKKRLHDAENKHRELLQNYNLTLEEQVRAQVKQLSKAHLSTIFSMSKLAESRDPETGEHLERMREYCKIVAQELRNHPVHKSIIDDKYIENIYLASPLHDIGKVGVPDRVLLKPGKLTDEEFDEIKKHPGFGAETLRAVNEEFPDNDFVHIGIEIAETHHEKWDGSGYPNGLSETDIPLSGRILALGDVYDALTSKRCYKDAFSHEKSRDIILEGKGKHFDPDVVEAFLKREDDFVDVRKKLIDTEKVLAS